jgi:uncharacterized membrane protein YedE/YeeE
MAIDAAAFAPWSGLAGGALIGAAAGILVLFNGRVAGISGVAGALLQMHGGDKGWRIAFMGALVAAPILYPLGHALPAVRIEASFAQLILAGLLVGLGTLYGCGCTSGHGVCGLARGSPRSLAATLVFVAMAMVTVFVMRHRFAS